MRDKEIICLQCEEPFLFSATEQQRFLNARFGIPKRCPTCRKNKHKANEENSHRNHRSRKKEIRNNKWNDDFS
jgi:hypothetical protein